MANCVTCGEELHPERAERYDYCLKPECRERNAKGLDIVAVGVNKAADQYVVLRDRTKQELEGGRYKRLPDVQTPTRKRPRPRRARRPATPIQVYGSSKPRPHWSKAHEELALIYRDRGMKPEEIAEKLGVSRWLVSQLLLANTR
jgi:hypothetical protein